MCCSLPSFTACVRIQPGGMVSLFVMSIDMPAGVCCLLRSSAPWAPGLAYYAYLMVWRVIGKPSVEGPPLPACVSCASFDFAPFVNDIEDCATRSLACGSASLMRGGHAMRDVRVRKVLAGTMRVSAL